MTATEELSMRAAVRTRTRPAPANAASAALTFAWRAVLKIKHVPEQLADVIGIPLLFTVLFTYLFGGALVGSTHVYLQFLLPGTLVLAVVFLTVYSGVTLNSDLSTGAFDRFRSLPIWRPAPIVGGLIGDAGRYLVASLLVLGLGYAMGFRAEGGPVGIVAAIGLAVLFSVALVLGVDRRRRRPARAQCCAQCRARRSFSAHLHEQRVRRTKDHACLAP